MLLLTHTSIDIFTHNKIMILPTGLNFKYVFAIHLEWMEDHIKWMPVRQKI